MNLSIKPYKGARDFYPDSKRQQKYMFNVMRSVVESFGYEEYDAPILESLELYAAKTGEEIVNEQTYTFVDRGGRNVAIRPEMTPSVARMVAAKRQELSYPLRWYSIPNLWRYERPQRGRLREHWQLNVDLFGIDNSSAEHEIITVADAIMLAFGAKREMYEIRLNSRKLMDTLMSQYLGLDATQSHMLSKLIDRMHKMDNAEFVAEVDLVFSPSQRDNNLSDKLLGILKVKELSDLPDELRSHESVSELMNLQTMLHKNGITNAVFDITLMRGFDYYTDIVFEMFDTNPDNNRSMFGGGRYDGLVALFNVESISTIGFGMGDVTLQNFLESHNLMPELKPETEAGVILVGDTYQGAASVVAEFREMGLKVSVDSTGRKLAQQIKNVSKKGIRFAIIIGDNELASQQYILRDLLNGEEQALSSQRIVTAIKDYRNT